MIKASGKQVDGRWLFVLGLSDVNLELLRKGKPLLVALERLGGSGDVVIMWGQTEEAIRADFEKAGLVKPGAGL